MIVMYHLIKLIYRMLIHILKIFIYGEDEFNLESHIMPHFIDIYLDKRDWIGTADINGIMSETSRFSHIRSIKDVKQNYIILV